jgi:photosystem II stability/assembly factor-like uncharacterized protein
MNRLYRKFSTHRLHAWLYIINLGLIPLLSLYAIIPNSPAAASPDAARWTRVNIPADGEAGNWVLADGSDVRHLTMASDGTLYAYVPGLTYTLYQSTDNGTSWNHIGNVQHAIADIAVSPHDSSSIYYATSSDVYRSSNDGKNLSKLPANPGGAGTGNREITSIDVTWWNGDIIAVATRDTDNSEFGGVYTLDGTNVYSNWVNTNIGSYDVYAVAFSPNYASDWQLVAVMTDETDTYVASNIGDSGWGINIGNARLDRDNSGIPTPVVVAAPAAVAFPGNYNADVASGNSNFFIAVNTGTDEGDVYRIHSVFKPGISTATDLNIGQTYGQDNTDITGLAACSDNPSIILAGAADSALTHLSNDGGITWTRSRKEPTGDSNTGVLIAPDFATSGRMYTATSGDGSALSISRDIGVTWNQLSLIDTTIGTIVDLALSPGYGHDGTLFMITAGGGHSLWRSRDGGSTWERTLSSNLDGVDNLSLVSLPPQYGADSPIVFAAGESSGNPAIWESDDNGQNYRRRFTHDPATGAAFTVDVWAIASETTLFIGSYDGSHGKVYQTTSGGFFYSESVLAGSQALNSLALSPDYEHDGTILVGNIGGWVYWSEDNGASFRPLPGDAASLPLPGPVTVAFDPGFDSNHTVYAASDAADGGIHRFVVDTSSDWESIGGTLPAGTIINRLTPIDNGTLYAANSNADGGMERCLNPTFTLGPTFETVTRGLSDGATLSGLWQSGGRLWSVDTTNIRLMTFNDTLTSPVTLISPDDVASGIGSLVDHTVRNVSLDWEAWDGATSYQWQCDSDNDFSSVPAGFDVNTTASFARLPALEPATTYYWRVRASAPVLSPWSEKRTFTTILDTETIALKPESPAAGASGVPAKPVFQWTAVAGSSAYELLVSADVDFNRPSIIKTGEYALPTNVWECDVSLEHDTTYYWKVRAINHNTRSLWSTVGAFTTESPPAEAPEKPPIEVAPPTPSPKIDNMPTQTPSSAFTTTPTTSSLVPAESPPPPVPPQATPTIPDLSQPPGVSAQGVYLIGGLLFTIILALIIILAMVLKMRHF